MLTSKLLRPVVIVILLGMLVASVLLSQFWALPALTQHPVKLTLLMGAGEFFDWQELLVKNFELENPDIQIELIEGPLNSDLTEDLYTSAFILGDSPYDLINMDVIWTPKFAAAGWLLDLSDRVSKDYLKEFLDKAVDSGRYQGKLYRIPFRSDGGMLYYRQDLLEQARFQAPKTFEQLVTISQQLQENHDPKWGYLWQGRQYEGLSAMFVEILAGFGGFWVDPETLEVGLDQPEAIKAVEFLRSTIKQGISPPGVTTYQEEETRLLFQNGDAVFLRNWPYVWSLANQEGSKVKGKIGISPMVHDPGGKAGACLGGWGLGIAKSSKHPEEAWRAIEYFSSEKAQRRYTLETGYLPTRRKLFADPEIVAKYPHYPKMLEVLEGAVLRPPVAQYSQVSDILQRYLNAVLTNPKLSAEKMMKAAADETRRLLSVE
ncbi:MAG: ABC transporter substrate-binding protein [Moorea sp. SIO3F7]|nr:ABC transporter substrate-binding protein [Moorena sp. SIO3E8]NEQ02217.1 ABC transporter substrate-binding protein [Moorena sp. SIO3F7]